MCKPVLSIEQLRVTIGGNPVVEGVDVAIEAGEIVTLVGESGCGKSMTAFAVMGLLPQVARRAGGDIRLGSEIFLQGDISLPCFHRGTLHGFIRRLPLEPLAREFE